MWSHMLHAQPSLFPQHFVTPCFYQLVLRTCVDTFILGVAVVISCGPLQHPYSSDALIQAERRGPDHLT